MTALKRARWALWNKRGPAFDVAFYAPWMGALLGADEENPPGGVETQIRFLARGLLARGHTVTIVCTDMAGLPRDFEGVRIVARPPWKPRRLLLPGVAFLLYIVDVWRSLGAGDAATYVHYGANADTGLLALFARLRGRRFVYSSANVIDFDYGRLEPRRRYVWLFHLGVRLAHVVVVQNMEQAELCRRRFGRSPVIISSIAEPGAQRRAAPEAFLWVGRLVNYKRPNAFIELACAVPEARFQMVIVPLDQEGRMLEAEISRRSRGVCNLELLHPRPREELLRLIDSAVAVVNTAEYEGLPNVFLESWARGVPVLSLTHDPDGVIERERIGKFAHGSPERLAELTRRLWRTRGNQREIATRCRAYVLREHAPDAVVDRWGAMLAGRNGTPNT
jgi:glycosyltransferase involved in cell wall biosynthesis